MVASCLGHVLGAVGAGWLDGSGELGRRSRELAARARREEVVAHKPPLDERVPRELGVGHARVVGRRLLREGRWQPADALLLMG